ncbi:hypothetical protein AB0F11_06145 [Streptomyces sp. NPDC032472]|uniref:hypothetical protein n=1 Tax=Streptomyces sp. NPDC032472 TaxID=3155018 RepID=UPI0034109094
MSERAAPFHCPYCGDEDLFPGEQGHGAWECRSCNRAFQLKYLGLLARGLRAANGTGTDTDTTGTNTTATDRTGTEET